MVMGMILPFPGEVPVLLKSGKRDLFPGCPSTPLPDKN